MPRILQVRTASADHTVGECILDSGFVIVCMKQLRCQLPTAQRAQLRLFLCRCSTWFVWLHVRDKAALGAFTPMPGFITALVRREAVRYLPFITANVASSVAGIVEDVHGLWAWYMADLTVTPMLTAVGFPIGTVQMTALPGKPA